MRPVAPAWLPGLPERWALVRGRTIAQLVQRAPSAEESIVTAFRDGQVTLRSNRRVAGFTGAIQEIGYQGVRTGELVIHSMDGFAGAIGVSESDGKMSPVVHIYSVPDDNPHYVAYALRVAALSGFIQSLAKGIRERSTSFDKPTFRNMLLPRPSRAEQNAIVAYLDRETARIDTLIEEQQRLIEMLRERRQGVLSAASDGNWPTASLGLLLQGIKDGTHGSFSRTAPGGGMPLLGARNIMDSRVVLDGAESYISVADHESIVASGFPAKGDVLLVIVGATIGKTAVYDVDTRHAFQRSVAFLRPSRCLDPKFLWYHIQTSRFQDELALRAKASAQPGIYLGDVRAIPVVVPPLAEQHQIVAQLDEQTARIDTLIAEAERFIDLSRERRAALITAAVTGQLDVRP